MVVLLGALYVRFGGMPWMRGAFYGIGAAVIAIIARSVVKLSKLTLARDRLLCSIFGSARWLPLGPSLRSFGCSSRRAPGPVVITVDFIGFLVAGFPGAVVAALGTFVPCYLFTVLPAPYFRRFAKSPQLKAFVDGVSAAATGAIAGAAFVLGRRAIFDLPTVLICLATLAIVTKFKKVQEPLVILVTGAVGLGISSFAR